MVTMREKRLIVKDYLLKQGFRINDGLKYGLDFLVYTDDPSAVHSKYGLIVFNSKCTYQQLVVYQRICNSNKKTFILAFVEYNNNVKLLQCERFNLHT